ncbi:hypothetical protein F2Q70_00005970 [Brassica cretica]|uniref:EF-hand domain-containing protein n=4 Tax=Brassica TaxID=3705 RepID=A0A8S9IMI8_BRACR|nr:hypothetical protein F2Q68_00022571 [Brassica cretica]KAF2571088.1 hypothetical protein F2Q70_00005970 [Brassica cretica]KAG2273702.1 hypothetical protein Bca52824_056257 [Brassica carinata]CAF1781392.1 unnamed protein product [Brassica napus]CDY16916.1 BnaC09g40430D [Brassica napus]
MRQRKPSTTIFQEIFDANADGKISAAELEEALKKLGSVTHDDVNRMMTEIDTDGDGNISYQEFIDFITWIAMHGRLSSLNRG